jgi:hypothetical protein
MSEKSQQAYELSKNIKRGQHGLFSNIPIICKVDKCPYRTTCPAFANDLAPQGEPCPVEIATITSLFDRYTKELNIEPDHITSIGLLKTVIENDIIIDRCNALLSEDGSIIQDNPVGATPNGTIMYKPEQHVALTIRANANRERTKALSDLNATPKDKSKAGSENYTDPSRYAAKIVAQYQAEMAKLRQEGVVIDAEFKPVKEADVPDSKETD